MTVPRLPIGIRFWIGVVRLMWHHPRAGFAVMAAVVAIWLVRGYT